MLNVMVDPNLVLVLVQGILWSILAVKVVERSSANAIQRCENILIFVSISLTMINIHDFVVQPVVLMLSRLQQCYLSSC